MKKFLLSAAGALLFVTPHAFGQSGASSSTAGSGSGIPYGAGGGTAQAQTVTTTPNITTLTTGTFVTWLPGAANTAAAPTLAAGTTAATPITKCGTVALVPGDLLSTVWAVAQYDGTEWVLQNPVQFGCSEGGLPTTGGTANAPTLTVAPAITAYSAGMVFNFTNGAANTGAVTIAISGLAAKNITKCGTTALVANDLTVAATAVILYDGTEFQLLNPQATGCGAGGGSGIKQQFASITFTCPASTTCWIAPNGQSESTSAVGRGSSPITTTGTVTGTSFYGYVSTSGAQPATGSLVCTLFAGAVGSLVSTGVSITVTANGSGLFQGAGSGSVTGGQAAAWQCVNNATTISGSVTSLVGPVT